MVVMAVTVAIAITVVTAAAVTVFAITAITVASADITVLEELYALTARTSEEDALGAVEHVGEEYNVFCIEYNAIFLKNFNELLNACNLDSQVVEATVTLAVQNAVGLLDDLKNDVNAEKEYDSECAVFLLVADVLDLLEAKHVCVEIYCLFNICCVKGDMSQALECGAAAFTAAITITHVCNLLCINCSILYFCFNVSKIFGFL